MTFEEGAVRVGAGIGDLGRAIDSVGLVRGRGRIGQAVDRIRNVAWLGAAATAEAEKKYRYGQAVPEGVMDLLSQRTTFPNERFNSYETLCFATSEPAIRITIV